VVVAADYRERPDATSTVKRREAGGASAPPAFYQDGGEK
jgi:hypothetical protein